ncbi:MAG: nitrite reductase (NAD(P)H) small subunit [SAR86 cluster bacterium]|uniref:Nitrite reductase (NAD(P)H) small subunit n=1 Tax=SAR86 cluster bacterium TaxID=2030880 RepID=A0A2A5AT66_9GAMM|nr:MAG: nitrite reductase (NAD(P)H) small subunit [SAR86 cluster bacterium]
MNNTTTQDEYWTTVCQLEQLLENAGHCVLLKEKQIAVFRLSGCSEIYAIDNFDPFSNANVISRGMVGDLNGLLVVASPIYKQHFDLASGQCVEDDEVKLATYQSRILDGAVQLALEKT